MADFTGILTLLTGTLVLTLTTVASLPAVPNLCPSSSKDTFFYDIPGDCSRFAMCDHGQPVIQSCAPGTVWNNAIKTCVAVGSVHDFCTSNKVDDRSLQGCAAGAGLLPDPLNCHRYTNCSASGTRVSRFLEPGQDECTYPQMFDAQERTCKHYSLVQCLPGQTEPKNPCDYVKNVCGSAHCEPCQSRLPSCVGLADGDYEHPSKPIYTITCQDERLARIQTCSRNISDPKPCFVSWVPRI